MKNRSILIVFILMFLLIFSGRIFSEDFIGHIERDAISVYDQEGNYIFATAMGVVEGDRYISEDNIEYLVEEINGNRAIAKMVGEVDLLAGMDTEMTRLTPLAADGNKLVGIYFTHNGESYEPGPDSVHGRGDIHEVGEVLKNALEEKGIRTIVSDNLHLPHDGAAYERSRATAVDISKERPDAIFDVHRDAIPRKDEYLTEVNGKQISRVRFVVGRQNPNREVNDKFARQLKAVADKQFPGLIKDIFYGRGDYNQEFSPHALLFEFGTHVITAEQAKASANMLAESINQLLYGGTGNQPSEGVKAQESSSALTTIAWILGILITGIFGYLFVNEGSWSGVVKRIRGFFGREILDRGDKE